MTERKKIKNEDDIRLTAISLLCNQENMIKSISIDYNEETKMYELDWEFYEDEDEEDEF